MEADDLIGTDLGGYRIARLLGEGEAAWVYRGENLLEPRIVRALKVLKPEYCADDIFAARFIFESSILERLNHPSIVRFYGVRHQRGLLVLELELLDGESIAALLSHVQQVPLPEAIRWMHQASSAVGVAHAQQVVHRDLKPANLHVVSDERLKVLDFGIARALEEARRLTQTRAKPRRSAYIPPEVILGEQWTTRSDVYALGLILFELLLGRYPYPVVVSEATDEYAVMDAIARSRPDPIQDVRSDVPAALLSFLEQCVSKVPAHRPSTGREFARELERYVFSEAPKTTSYIEGLSNVFGSKRRN